VRSVRDELPEWAKDGSRNHVGPDCLLALEGEAKTGDELKVRDDGHGLLVAVGNG
jgi:hypothetical protein